MALPKDELDTVVASWLMKTVEVDGVPVDKTVLENLRKIVDFVYSTNHVFTAECETCKTFIIGGDCEQGCCEKDNFFAQTHSACDDEVEDWDEVPPTDDVVYCNKCWMKSQGRAKRSDP